VDVLLECNSSTRVIWYFEGKDVHDNAILSEDNSLVIYGVEDLNAGQYECRGRNEFGDIFYGEVILEVFGQ